MIKKLFCIIPLICLLLMIVFWEPIAGTFIKTCINGYCRYHFGGELQAEKVYKQQGYWAFEKPLISHNGAQLSAERILFSVGLKPLKRTVELEVIVENSHIDLREEITNLEDVMYDIISKTVPYWLFKVHSSFTIENGKISWNEKINNRLTENEADFRFLAVSKTEQKQATLGVFLAGKENQSNFFELQANKEQQLPLRAELLFRNVSCSKIARIYQAFGHAFHGWEISDGEIDGKIYYHHPENRRAYVWGEATLKNFAFGNPQQELTGSLLEAKFNLEAKVGDKEIPRVTGSISLSREGSFAQFKNGSPYWELNNLEGEISFLPGEGINVLFGGQCKHEDHSFGLKIKGDASVFDDTQAAIGLSCLLSNPNKEDAEVQVVVRQLGSLYNLAEIQLNGFGKEEFKLAQKVLSSYCPDLHQVQMRNGRFAASGIAYMEDFSLSEMKIDKIFGDHLLFDFEPLDMSVYIEKASGDFSFNFSSSNPLETIDANVSLNDGNFDFLGINGNVSRFEKITTELAVRKGVLQKSELKGHFAGLDGTFEVDWASRDEFLKVNFFGKANKLSSFMPINFTKPYEHNFPNDFVNIIGGMSWHGEGARFKGKLIFTDLNAESEDTIAFGFDVEKSSEKLWKRWPADELAISYWEKFGLEAMQKAMPPIISPLILFESNWLKAESGIAGIVVRKGWFQAEKLNLKKYVAPFVFPDDQMELKGIGDFKGFFDLKRIAVEYTAENIVLENQYMRLDLDKILSGKKGEGQTGLYAAHYFDIEKGLHFGTIPLSQASYLEKNSELHFTNIDALVILEGNKVYFSDLTTKCHGLELDGAIDIDFDVPNDGRFAVDVKVEKLKGTLPQVKDLLGHFNPDPSFINIPIDGDVSLSNEAATFSFAFEPGDFLFDAKVKGMVSDAEMSFENSSLKINGAKLNFSYDHENKSLDISNIYGNVLVGDPLLDEHYVLSGEYIRFVDYANNKAEFDVWIGDQSRDIIRLVGKTLPEESVELSHKVSFHINHELTHFGDVHPADFQLIVKDWKSIDYLNLGLDIRLNTLFHDLQRFGKSGVLPDSMNLAEGLNNIRTASGDVRVELNYKGESGEFHYNIEGNDIVINNYVVKDCKIRGRKSGEYWCLNSLHLDDLFISAYIKNKNKLWTINQMQFRYGDAISMILDGSYLTEENMVKAHVSALEMKFEELSNCGPFIDSFIKSSAPHGKMIASGELQFAPKKNIQGWRLEAILDATLLDWDMKGLYFQDVQNVSCHFVSDKGITLRNLSTNIITPDTRLTRAQFSFEKASYEFLNGELLYDNLKFQVPSHHLPWFADAMMHSFPATFTPACADVMKNCKLQGNLEGTLHYEYNPPYTAIQLRLQDGKYLFLNSEHDLKNCVMEYDPFEFKAVSKYGLGDDHVWLYARSTSPNLASGELVLSDLSPNLYGTESSNQNLFILWENDTQYGISIKRAEGKYSGLNVQLQRDLSESLSEKAMHLIGRVDINPQAAKGLFPEEISKKVVDWKIGDGYRLNGKWRVQKDSSQDYANKLHFLGTFEGNQFSVKGYQFDSMIAHLEYTPKSARFRDFSIVDASGTLTSDRMDLVKGGDGHWYFSMPEMKIEKFRPSILKEEGMHRPHLQKPLVIRELVVEGCQGSLSNSETIIGKGYFKFINRSKKRLQNTIFQIPSDILSRIGLDLSVLTPITGTVEYKLQNGNVYLTKFKDVYSESKLSKFNLSNSSPSTVDFEGNLNVNVKMNQNNLLFKLAELFTVNIGGSLQKPTYSLQKQNREVTLRNSSQSTQNLTEKF